jgi:ADP-ribose pyrophosphatase
MSAYDVVSSEEVYRDRLFRLRRDLVRMPGGVVADRAVLTHPGAVVIAAVDADDRIVLVRQYRHPLRRFLSELPAGLLDVVGESALQGARRELAEEAGVVATQWHTLVDLAASPGISEEVLRVYLARGLSEVDPADRYVASGDEEAEMTLEWVALDEAVRRALAGELENAAAVAGVLAAARARDAGWSGLRPADAPWAARRDRARD